MPEIIQVTEGQDTMTAAVDLYRPGEAVIVRGQGGLSSILYQQAGLNAPALFYSSVMHNGISFRDFYLDGARATNPTGTIGIDGSNMRTCADVEQFRGVQVWHCSSHGFKNAAYVAHCVARENTGSGFYNDAGALFGHHTYTSHNEQYGYRLWVDSVLSHFRADEDAVGIYLPNGCYPIKVTSGEVTMSNAVPPYTVPSTIGIEFATGVGLATDPSYQVNNVMIGVAQDNMTGIKFTGNHAGANLSDLTIFGDSSGTYSGQIFIDIDDSANRCLFSNIVLTNTNGTGLRLNQGNHNRFNNIQMMQVTTPIDLVAGDYITNWRFHQLKIVTNVPTEYLSENGGSATITAGQTFVAVTHGLFTIPNFFTIVAKETAGAAWFVDTVGASTFRINITGAAGADTHFYWEAKVSP